MPTCWKAPRRAKPPERAPMTVLVQILPANDVAEIEIGASAGNPAGRRRPQDPDAFGGGVHLSRHIGSSRRRHVVGGPVRLPLWRGNECLARAASTIRCATGSCSPRAMLRPLCMRWARITAFASPKEALQLRKLGSASSRAIPMCWTCPGWRRRPARWARACRWPWAWRSV